MAAKVSIRELAVAVSRRLILRGISLDIEANTIVSVIGPAHSGKTTLLRWLALQCARVDVETAANPWRNGIPFLIPLRSLEPKDKGRPKLERFLSHTIDPDVWSKKPPEGWIERVLKQGRALVLIDGIDELPTHLRPKFWTWLEEFVRHQPGNRIYVTSRPFPEPEDDSIGQLWNPPPEFIPAELDEMNDQDIRAFVNNWHDAVILSEEDEQEPDPERCSSFDPRPYHQTW